jgi:Protein of unknown function (DUF3341)
MTERPLIFGLMAEFETAEELLTATKRTWQAGYREMDAYTPYSIEGLPRALGQRSSDVPFVVLLAGIVGACTGFFMQYWSMAVDYPFNVGGRPINSWPVFIPVAFEMMILVASFGAFLGMLFLNGLPRPHHPVFNVPAFARASQDRFFLCIEATDHKFDLSQTADFLSAMHPRGGVMEVPFDISLPTGEEMPAPKEAVTV